MWDPELMLDAGRQRHDERLRDAMNYRTARLVRASQPRTPAWIRWGIADTVMSLGERLRADRTPDCG